jgi:hypothetical protein
MILKAGTFRTSDYRKAIPRRVELAVLIRQKCKADDGVLFKEHDAIEFDHDPSLDKRDFDTVADDFIPPQHDPAKIVARRKGKHLEKTTGRKEGAEKTVTTRGSDIGERARARKIGNRAKVHNFKMAAKTIGADEAAKLYPEVERLQRRRRGRKLQGRGFGPGHRPLRSNNTLRRQP